MVPPLGKKYITFYTPHTEEEVCTILLGGEITFSDDLEKFHQISDASYSDFSESKDQKTFVFTKAMKMLYKHDREITGNPDVFNKYFADKGEDCPRCVIGYFLDRNIFDEEQMSDRQLQYNNSASVYALIHSFKNKVPLELQENADFAAQLQFFFDSIDQTPFEEVGHSLTEFFFKRTLTHMRARALHSFEVFPLSFYFDARNHS
jgi:hypothetical protein